MKSIRQLKREVTNAEIEVLAFRFLCESIEKDRRKVELANPLSVMQRQLGLWQARLIKARQDLATLKSGLK